MYSFDNPAYARCYELPQVCMDKRHVYILHDILSAWPFKSALEIGSFAGASATAFVEAINRGSRMIATFCDVSVSASLMDVVLSCKTEAQVRVTAQPSWAVLDSKIDFDFIFVDGAHDIDTVTLEVKRLLKRKPLCVMAHDTNATEAGYSQCEGAAMLAWTFRNHPDYLVLEDNLARPFEQTNRGLFFATTEPALMETAQDIFRKWNTWNTDSNSPITATRPANPYPVHSHRE